MESRVAAAGVVYSVTSEVIVYTRSNASADVIADMNADASADVSRDASSY